ncbi:MAG: hypothetical protein A2X02_01395 [Bacteroidetes bacterium GWF2_29_10]|nr:MAG: hypothetical protein A2X02_01395 [Bacteroidetes bacterium GWF2_29_10]
MKMQGNPIDDIYKKVFEGYEESPPDSIWTNIKEYCIAHPNPNDLNTPDSSANNVDGSNHVDSSNIDPSNVDVNSVTSNFSNAANTPILETGKISNSANNIFHSTNNILTTTTKAVKVISLKSNIINSVIGATKIKLSIAAISGCIAVGGGVSYVAYNLINESLEPTKIEQYAENTLIGNQDANNFVLIDSLAENNSPEEGIEEYHNKNNKGPINYELIEDVNNVSIIDDNTSSYNGKLAKNKNVKLINGKKIKSKKERIKLDFFANKNIWFRKNNISKEKSLKIKEENAQELLVADKTHSQKSKISKEKISKTKEENARELLAVDKTHSQKSKISKEKISKTKEENAQELLVKNGNNAEQKTILKDENIISNDLNSTIKGNNESDLLKNKEVIISNEKIDKKEIDIANELSDKEIISISDEQIHKILKKKQSRYLIQDLIIETPDALNNVDAIEANSQKRFDNYSLMLVGNIGNVSNKENPFKQSFTYYSRGGGFVLNTRKLDYSIAFKLMYFKNSQNIVNESINRMVNFKFRYVQVPLMITYKFYLQPFTLGFSTGFEGSYLYNQKNHSKYLYNIYPDAKLESYANKYALSNDYHIVIDNDIFKRITLSVSGYYKIYLKTYWETTRKSESLGAQMALKVKF